MASTIRFLERGAHVMVQGPISVAGYLALNTELMSHPDFPHHEFVLWEYDEDATIQCMARDVRDLATADLEASRLIPGRRVAVVVSSDLLFGLSRMYTGFFQGGDWEVRTFRKRSEAEDWLGVVF